MSYSFRTRPGNPVSIAIPTKYNLTGYTLTVQVDSHSDFSAAVTRGTATYSDGKVVLSLTGAEVDTTGDGYFRIKADNGTTNFFLTEGNIDYIPATTSTIDSSLLDSNGYLKEELLPPVSIPTLDDEVSGLVDDDASQTAVRLRAAYAAAGLPSHAGIRVHRYDPTRNAYNWRPSNTRKLRASLGRAEAGAGLASWGWIGDSETDYFVGTGSDFGNMHPRVCRAVLASLGIPVGGSGLIWAAHYGPQVDPRWTADASWSNANNYLVSTVSGATLTFAPTDAGTAVDLVVFGNSAPIDWSIDSGAHTGTLAPSGGLVPVRYTLASGLSNAAHTLTLTTTSTAGTYILAARVYGTSGLEVHNAAAFGAQASGDAGWVGTTDVTQLKSRVDTLLTVAPDVIWCALGVNDTINGVASATITAAISTLRATFAASDFILTAEYQPAGAATWSAFVGGLYDLADSLDVPLIDLYDRSGGTDAADAAGLMGDTVHPNSAAQRDWGRLEALLAAA